MPSFRQSSFAAGELSPTLWGRTDLDKYAQGVKRCKNFFISRQGAAVSRPGTKYIATANISSDGPVRLVPFVFSDSQSFALEFGRNTIRFYTNGAQVKLMGLPYLVVTTYTIAELPYLKFSQVGNVITITHPNHAPAELRRITNNNWTWTPITFALPDPDNIGGSALITVTLTYKHCGAYITGSVYSIGDYVIYGGATYVSNANNNQLRVPGSTVYDAAVTYVADDLVTFNRSTWRSIQDGNVGQTPDVASSTWWVVANLGVNIWWTPVAANTLRYWTWYVSALVEDQPGIVRETIATTSFTGAGLGLVALNAENVATFTFGYGAAEGANPVWGFRIYRGIVGGPAGLVGTHANPSTGTFVDDGTEPDYTQMPPQQHNPFTTTAPGGSSVIWTPSKVPPASGPADYPACVGMYEQRQVYANMPSRPATTFLSVVGNYYNFDVPLLPRADTMMQIELAANRLFGARSLAQIAGHLIEFGDSGIWAISGNGAPIAYNSVDAKQQSDVGASWLTPITVNNESLFTRSKGVGVSTVAYDFRYGKFNVSDLSFVSEHLFVGHTINDWTYAETPWGIVWAVRSDGALLSLSYLPEQNVMAWSEHDTQGIYESVCSVPNGTGDDVYVAVARTIGGTTVRMIEIMTNRVVTDDTDPQDVICLDASVSPTPGAPITVVSGLDHLDGETVYALADGNVQGPFVVNGSGQITLEVPATVVHVGLQYLPQLQPLGLNVPGKETRTLKKTVTKVSVDVYQSRGFYAGPDFDNLDNNPQRVVGDDFNEIALQTGLVEINIGGGWDQEASVAIQQTDPLPLTILAVSREVEFGDY